MHPPQRVTSNISILSAAPQSSNGESGVMATNSGNHEIGSTGATSDMETTLSPIIELHIWTLVNYAGQHFDSVHILFGYYSSIIIHEEALLDTSKS